MFEKYISLTVVMFGSIFPKLLSLLCEFTWYFSSRYLINSYSSDVAGSSRRYLKRSLFLIVGFMVLLLSFEILTVIFQPNIVVYFDV